MKARLTILQQVRKLLKDGKRVTVTDNTAVAVCRLRKMGLNVITVKRPYKGVLISKYQLA